MSETTHDVSNEVRPSRRWRWLKLCGLGSLAILGVALIWFAVANWRASARLNAKLAELKAEGVPLSLVELQRTPPPPEQNAVTYLLRAREETSSIARAIEEACKAAGDTDEDSTQYDALWAGRPGASVLDAIRDTLAKHTEAVPLLVQASNCPDYDWQYDYDAGTQFNDRETSFFDEVFEQLGYKRDIFRVLYYQSLLLASEGECEQSLRTCEAMLRLAKLYGRDPLLVNYLVANAVYMVTVSAINQGLRTGPVSSETHQQLEAELAADDLDEQFRRAMMTERAYALQSFQDMSELWSYAVTMFPPFKRDNAYMASVFDKFANSTQRPFDFKLSGELKAIQESGGVFTGLVLPALLASRGSLARVQALQRCARVLNHLIAQDPDGNKSVSIEKLGLPADATTDPFNGKPLRTKHTNAGWLVYSVGQNLKDDGGQLDDERTDVGLGPVVVRQ